MSAEVKTEDPFAAMMARRVKTIEVEGWPTFELREAPMSEVEPLIFADGSIPPQEMMFQLVGLSIWIGEHRGSADMIKRMGPSALKRLMEVVQKDIFDLYGIKVDEDDEAASEANGEAKTPTPRRKKKG